MEEEGQVRSPRVAGCRLEAERYWFAPERADIRQEVAEEDDEQLRVLVGLEHQVRRLGKIVLYEHRPVHHPVDHLPCRVEDDRFPLEIIHVLFEPILVSDRWARGLNFQLGRSWVP